MNSDLSRVVPWADGSWMNQPEAVDQTPLGLKVTATAHSDAWRGADDHAILATQNALVVDFLHGSAMEVEFIADMTAQFDQAGIFLHVAEDHWAKAGMELTQGQLQVGAVVTWRLSDWSACRMSDWNGRAVRVRMSWQDNAVIVRASVDGEKYRLVRWFPLDSSLKVQAGPYLASPSRGGLSITFTDWRTAEADEQVHLRASS